MTPVDQAERLRQLARSAPNTDEVACRHEPPLTDEGIINGSEQKASAPPPGRSAGTVRQVILVRRLNRGL